MIDFFISEPMKYWAPPASMNKEMRKMKLETMASSGEYLYGIKTDGNWSRAIITPEHSVLQTRGISKVTGTYGEIQDKVFFWDAIKNAFHQTTVILGEVFLPGKIDKDIGAILRCLEPKALARQREEKLRWRIFDILCYEGAELLNTNFEERIKYIPIVVKQINSPLVEGVNYNEMTPNFFEEMQDIFATGGEGAVCYRKDCKYEPGKRGPHSWDTCKVKQEITNDIDCFIIGIEPPIRDYTGKDIETWNMWQDQRTGEKIIGELYPEYRLGRTIRPITKGYYYGWPGAIEVGVYDNTHKIVSLCKVAGLTEEFKTELRDHYDEWHMCPVTIGGMMVSTATENLSIRHPYLKTIRKNDIDPADCTLSKIL